MIAPTQMNKPRNWQDFEKLCKLLWGEMWGCEDTIKQHGRQGQNQHGVDVYAYVEKYGGYCGIQCKGKDDYTKAELTEGEIDAEITKALSFEPELKLFVFATTANKDAKIEGYIRKKDVENRNNGRFRVEVFSWEDIVDQLERYRDTYNWYVNNCQFKEATDVKVTFDGEEEVVIHPEYIKKITCYEVIKRTPEERALLSQLSQMGLSFQPGMSVWNRPRKIDKRWCKLHIRIDNIGRTVIKTPKLIVFFREKDIEDIDDRFYYCNEPLLNDSAKAQINANKDANREVFQEYANGIVYRPKESVFVQKDKRVFTISIIAADGITELPMFWRFLCEDYQKNGSLMVKVEPEFEEKVNRIEVDSEADLKPDEILIVPKIIEK